MKNWADISSDEESDHGQYHPSSRRHPAAAVAPEDRPKQAEPEEKVARTEELEKSEEQAAEEPPPKAYEFPTDPPFTSYVGNLAYSVTQDQLAGAISNLVQERFQKQVRVVRTRVAFDRKENRPRGFGYVEVETVDDLKALMELNDGKSVIAGRTIKLDVAQPQRRSQRSLQRDTSGSFSDQIDGSQFRGGRYARGRDSQRESSSTTMEGEEPSPRRSSLRLAPRSKPREDTGEEDENADGAGQNIFGRGKPRDGSSWEQRQRRPSNSDRRPSDANSERRSSTSSATGGRGGRSGRGGRGDFRRRSSSNRSSGRGNGKEDSKKMETSSRKTEAPMSPTGKPVPSHVHQEQVKPTATKKVVNKFAALQFDSDSE